MEIYIEQAEKHIQINEYHANRMEDFRSFWKDFQSKYIGFTIDFCYHNCSVPIEFMMDINAEVLESCIETRLSHEHFKPTVELEPTIVTEENFIEFARLHDEAYPVTSGMYWTSERIEKDLNHWLIYMYYSNYLLMRIGSDTSEIYTIEVKNKNVGETLISKASEYAFRTGKTGVLCMVDDNKQTDLEMLQSVGFITCGKYICYRAIIK